MQVFEDVGLIYVVLEYGDIDLARLLQNHEEARRRQLASGVGAASSGVGNCAAGVTGGSGEIDENFIRLYWQQMLQVRGVRGRHAQRSRHSGCVHRKLSPGCGDFPFWWWDSSPVSRVDGRRLALAVHQAGL
jgi:hypothetical protein